ncbi:MAG: hypothetical protein E4G99_00515 [Anaerolineales bacterium]|nr:MAG: hypothetical protein E4G99_00515 [Anaerolineales bacterium]
MMLDKFLDQSFSHRKLLLLVIPLLAISGCSGISNNGNSQEEGGPLAWIDAPLTGETIPLAPYEVISHANSAPGIVAFELSVDGEILRTDEVVGEQTGEPLAHIRQIWDPPGPGTYLLSIRALDTDGILGPLAEVEVRVGEVQVSALALSTASPTVALKECSYTALVNLFCRVGPGSQYKEIDTFTTGQFAPILGMSLDGFYWYVKGPNNGSLCTVPDGAQFGEVSGDCAVIPAFTPIPLPTATPTSTPTCTPGVVGC